MYYLHQSDNLDRLLLEGLPILKPRFDDNQTLYVIQSTVMQRWFKFRLASLSGVSAIPPLLVPDQSMRLLLSQMTAEKPEALFLDDLILAVHQELQKIAAQIAMADSAAKDLAAIYAPVLPYLGFEKQGELQRDSQAGLLFDLANEFAGVLFSYAQNPVDDQAGNELLGLWSKKDHASYLCDQLAQSTGLSPSNPLLSRLRQHEVWQADIFRRLFDSSSQNNGILGLLMQRAIQENWVYSGPYKRIIMFGSAFLSRRAFHFVHHLSKTLEVQHFLFRPGLGEVQGSLSHQWSRLARDLDHELVISIQKEETVLSTSSSGSSEASQATSDLERIRYLIKQDSSQQSEAQLEGDGSFSVIASSTAYRQVESLYQRLLARLEQTDPSNKLGLEQILVIAPEIQNYRPAIEAVFGPPGPRRSRAHDPHSLHLAWNMADLGFGAASAWLKASRSLFDLSNSRWERSLLGSLISNPCFYRKHGFSKTDQESLMHFIEKANIRWGYDAKQRKTRGGGDNQEQTWFSGFRRFCQDYPYAQDEDQASLSGFDQSEASIIGKLFAILDQVHAQFEDFKSKQCTLDVWVDSCFQLLEETLTTLDDDDKQHQNAVVSTLFQLKHLLRDKALADPKAELDWFSYWHFFNDQLDQVEGGLGQRMASGITFSSIKPYRAVRFKLIVMLGCDEVSFPRRNQWQSFDLGILGNLAVLPDFAQEYDQSSAQKHLPLGGRLAAEIQDSWAWLETIYSAAQALWLYYEAIDQYSGKKKLPSPFLSSILDKLDLESQLRISIDEGLHAYDLLPSSAPSPLRSKRFIERARALAQARPLSQRIALETASQLAPSQVMIGLNELAEMFIYPVNAYARYSLELSLKTRRDILSNEEENLALNFWTSQNWLRELLGLALQGRGEHFIEEKLASQFKLEALMTSSFDFITSQKIKQQAEVLNTELLELVGEQKLELSQQSDYQMSSFASFMVDASQSTVFMHTNGQRYIFSTVNSDLKKPFDTHGVCKLGAEELLKLYLPVLMLDILWPQEQGSHHIRISTRPDSTVPYYQLSSIAKRSSAESQSSKAILEQALTSILSKPQPLYMDFLDAEHEADSWQDWWQLALDEQVYSPDGGNKQMSKSGKAISCSWLSLLFPDSMPDKTDDFDLLIQQVYLNLIQEAKDALRIAHGAADSEEDL